MSLLAQLSLVFLLACFLPPATAAASSAWARPLCKVLDKNYPVTDKIHRLPHITEKDGIDRYKIYNGGGDKFPHVRNDTASNQLQFYSHGEEQHIGYKFNIYFFDYNDDTGQVHQTFTPWHLGLPASVGPGSCYFPAPSKQQIVNMIEVAPAHVSA